MVWLFHHLRRALRVIGFRRSDPRLAGDRSPASVAAMNRLVSLRHGERGRDLHIGLAGHTRSADGAGNGRITLPETADTSRSLDGWLLVLLESGDRECAARKGDLPILGVGVPGLRAGPRSQRREGDLAASSGGSSR